MRANVLMGGRGIFLKIQTANTAHDNGEVKKIYPIPQNSQIPNTFFWQVKKWTNRLEWCKEYPHQTPSFGQPFKPWPRQQAKKPLVWFWVSLCCGRILGQCCSCCGVVMEHAVTSQPTEVGGNLAICPVTVSDFCYLRWCNICGTMIPTSQCRCLTQWGKKSKQTVTVAASQGK